MSWNNFWTIQVIAKHGKCWSFQKYIFLQYFFSMVEFMQVLEYVVFLT